MIFAQCSSSLAGVDNDGSWVPNGIVKAGQELEWELPHSKQHRWAKFLINFTGVFINAQYAEFFFKKEAGFPYLIMQIGNKFFYDTSKSHISP